MDRPTPQAGEDVSRASLGSARAARLCSTLVSAAVLASTGLASASQATAPVVDSAAVAESWRLLDLPPAWVVVLVVLPLVALVAFGTYWREAIGRRPRLLLSALRAVSLVLLLLVLARPVKVLQQQDVQPAEVLVLVDDSASMAKNDDYGGDDEARRGLAAFAPEGDVAKATRSELARKALTDHILPTLEARGYVPRVLRFAESAQAVSDPARLEARGAATHVGDALRQALASYRGRHVSDILLVTDGRSNGGSSPQEAAASAGLPVHALLVGDSNPERNRTVELVDAPESVLEGDEVELAFRVSERGGDGARREASIVLEELPLDGRGEPLVAANERVELSSTGTRVVLVAERGGLDPGATERRFRARIDAADGERNTLDNEVTVAVRVNRQRVRVLYVEGYPRYEYRFLNFMLRRADARIDVQMYLLSATPDFPQDRTSGLPSLTRVPTSRKELLDNYDVVLLGDVNPYAVSPDPAKGEEFVRSLLEFVELGGGLGIIAGEYQMPRSVAGTDFANLLPVELSRVGTTVNIPTDVEHRPLLEDPAAPHELVRFEQDLAQNRALFESPRGLRGFFWHFPVAGVKPGAQVLMRHPVATNQVGGERDPLLVLGHYPAGRSLFLAIEATNRWQFRYDAKYFEGFWRNALRWLALGRLKSGDRRFRLEALRTEYALDDRVTLEARVLDEDFRPAELEVQEVLVAAEGDPSEAFDLAAVPGRPGLYRGTFQAERPGRFRAWIEFEGRRATSTEFAVVLPSRETADPRPDPDALAALTSLAGGVLRPLHEVEQLLGATAGAFPGGEERREPISSELEDAWDRFGTLLLALAVLSLEWILRKRYELV
jgi:uncharacterized membrane protein